MTEMQSTSKHEAHELRSPFASTASLLVKQVGPHSCNGVE
jgi:hypothetical protein